MTYSQRRGFRPAVLLAWIRSEASERYEPKPANPMHDPWWSIDPDHETRFAYVPAVAW